MALKVKAKEREMKVGKNPGEYRYVMLPELYSTLDQDKVINEAAIRSGVNDINEAAIRSGVNEGVMRACWDGAGKVIKAWATEGHSVALPGLGTMRFGLRAKAVEDVNDVKASLIKTRRIIFTLKDELKDTAIQITCYDRNGEEVKRVTSADPGTVEDPENESTDNGSTENGSGTENGGSSSGGSGIVPGPSGNDQPEG